MKFSEHKEKIQEALNSRLANTAFSGEDKGFTLVDGFFNLPIQDELSGDIIIGGPTIPMISIVGNSTGRMYFFALKVLLPDIDKNETNDD